MIGAEDANQLPDQEGDAAAGAPACLEEALVGLSDSDSHEHASTLKGAGRITRASGELRISPITVSSTGGSPVRTAMTTSTGMPSKRRAFVTDGPHSISSCKLGSDITEAMDRVI